MVDQERKVSQNKKGSLAHLFLISHMLLRRKLRHKKLSHFRIVFRRGLVHNLSYPDENELHWRAEKIRCRMKG